MTRRIRLMMAWTMVLSLTVGSGAFSAMAQEGTPAAPVSSADQLFEVDGIDAPIVAQAPIGDASNIDGVLLLERLELPAAAQLAPRTPASPELYYVESGALSIQDDFGFGTTIPAGNGLPLNAGTTFTLANQGVDPAVVLRLRLSDGAGMESGGAAEATPVDLTAGTTQAADDIAPTVLVQMPVTGLSVDSGQMFLSRATFSPGSATGEQGHAGPIGLYVESGALNVVSPSGFEGTIGAGQGVSLPAETPLQASTADSEAVVLIVGLGAADQPFGAVTDELEPEVATEEATKATETETPEPIVDVVSDGTILQLGETWQVPGAAITVTLDDSNIRGVGVDIAYTNLTEIRVDFLPSTGALRVYDDQRSNWQPRENDTNALLNNRIILEPGETIEFYVWIVQPNEWNDYSANAFLVVEGFGEIGYARWGFTYNNGRVLTIPPDAIDPTVGAQSGGSQEQARADSSQPPDEPATADISGVVASLSPPHGLAVKEQGSLGADQITATFSDPAAASRFFNDWGWQENAFAYYEPPNGGSSADGLVYVDIGLHRFASADGATQALTYFADVRRDQMGLGDVQIAPIGEQSRAIIGPTDMGTEASVYSRVGTVAIRVSVMSVATDPLAVAISIVQGIVGAPQASAAPVDLASLLPGAGDVPAQLVVTGDHNRTMAEVAANYQNPAEVTSLFAGWGWQGNVTRAWQLPSGASVEQTQINGVYVSIHAFGSPESAVAALDYSLADQSSATGAWEVSSPGLGDYSRALYGQETYGNEITLLVQRGNLLIRVSAAQLDGDPTPTASGIVQGIIGREG